MNTARAATRMGTSTAASTYMPVRVTPPMRRVDMNGWGYTLPPCVVEYRPAASALGLKLGM